MKFKSLEDTFIYRHLNASNGLTKNILHIMKDGKVLTQKDLEEAFLIINKNFKFPLKYKVMEEFQEGDIKLLYSPENYRVPTCLPFFLSSDLERGNKVIASVVVDIYGRMNEETGSVTIDPKKLYCMMEGALLARKYYKDNAYLGKGSIASLGSAIYSGMFTRVLNKKYALNVDKSRMHKVIFLSSKFFLINVLGMPNNEITTNYAMKNCIGGNTFILKEVDEMVGEESYRDLSTFITALGTKKELSLKMDDLTVRGYLEKFISMYDASALLALEHFAYFMYNIISVVNGAYINNQYILEDIVEKYGPKLYVEIVNL